MDMNKLGYWQLTISNLKYFNIRNFKVTVLLSFILVAFASCTGKIATSENLSGLPDIFPDYIDVTVPPNIAPLNFTVNGVIKGFVRFECNGYSFDVHINDGNVKIPGKKWGRIVKSNLNSKISVTVFEKSGDSYNSFLPFNVYIVDDEIDPYIIYRLIDPGYELWNEMGIFQHSLTDGVQTTLYKNGMTEFNCINCHSFPNNDPENISFHMRAIYPGTYIIKDNNIEKLSLDTSVHVASLVYPSWHPSEKYIAFSTNDTKQGFHINDLNRIEVYDRSSDIVVYNVDNHEIITSPLLFSKTSYETFPTFSPDGNSIYFCSTPAIAMPDSFKVVHYDLLRIHFDPITGTFGNIVDTIFNCGDTCSVSFPRISPDGNYLLFTVSDYGNFSIWHNEADLKMIDLRTGNWINTDPWNSDKTESYHSWSSNSRWVVISSRRGTGLYTRPFLGYIDDKGNTYKPFLLPQKDVDFYKWTMKSFNIPEFAVKPSQLDAYKVSSKAKSDETSKISIFKIK